MWFYGEQQEWGLLRSFAFSLCFPGRREEQRVHNVSFWINLCMYEKHMKTHKPPSVDIVLYHPWEEEAERFRLWLLGKAGYRTEGESKDEGKSQSSVGHRPRGERNINELIRRKFDLFPGCVCLSVSSPTLLSYLVLNTLVILSFPLLLPWKDLETWVQHTLHALSHHPAASKHQGAPSPVKVSPLSEQTWFDSWFFKVVILSWFYLWYITFWK